MRQRESCCLVTAARMPITTAEAVALPPQAQCQQASLKFCCDSFRAPAPRWGSRSDAAHVKFVLDGETRQVEGRQLKVKRLGARALSHEEDRPDFVHLDYTPINVHLPIDLLYPVRMRRRMNQIEGLQLALLVGIHLNGNEEPRDVAHTLSALANSLQMLKQRTDIEWDECGVVLLVDGRSTLSEELKHFLAHEIRIYDESLLELTYDGSDTTVHLFERSVELPKHQTQRSYHDPLQMSLAVKERESSPIARPAERNAAR